ncbi:ferritin family protein [Bradyrhizobium sp. SZCCHNR1070]|uniref:ferritin family protein n=1 Tax=Bradyrhizobium sp. SZCCHNR1070 TaxID=3057361 RepID=UPI002916C34C|nr:ferritin family protein [Bradyrhizobium sp. SZCCHNR1070]
MLLTQTLLLKSEPAGTLHSLDELFALAHAMEQEAADRYGELAEHMRCQDKDELAAVFTRLAAAEREHVDSVARWSQSRTGHAPDPATIRWQAPETFDSETAAEMQSSRRMTPYRALAIAVRNEERAFAFWSYVAAYAKTPDIKSAAEAMAREELGHVATLRRQRRHAFHAERDARQASGAAISPGDAVDAQVDAGAIEHRLTLLLGQIDSGLTGAAADRVRELQRETAAMAVEAEGAVLVTVPLATADAPALAEALADAYLDGAERATDPEQLDRLQRLAGKAVARLAWLHSLTSSQ